MDRRTFLTVAVGAAAVRGLDGSTAQRMGVPDPAARAGFRFLVLDGTHVHSRPCYSARGDRVLFMRAPAGEDPNVSANSDRSPWTLWSVPRRGGDPEPFFEDPGLGATRPDACRATGRVAFTGIRGERAELYLIDADGRNLRHVPVGDPPRGRILYPSWFPDGDRIAVTDYERRQVLAVSVSTGRLEPLTDPLLVSAGMAAVSSGSDGKLRLALAGQPPSQHGDVEGNQIWLAEDHGDLRRLDNSPGRTPAWSPTETRLAYASARRRRTPAFVMFRRRIFASGRSSVFLASPAPDETAAWYSTALSPIDHTAIHPKWSPDGAEVAMMARSLGDGRSGIAVATL